MCLTIDFWPRYLVLLLPILILIVGKFFDNKQWVLVLILFSYLPWLWFNFVPDKTNTIDKWNELINKGQYRDAYRLIDNSSRGKVSEYGWNNYIIKGYVKENNLWKIKIK